MKKEIVTRAFESDTKGNLLLHFGEHYIGIEAGKVVDEDQIDPDVHYVKFEELEEPFFNEKSKKEDYKPRKDMGAIVLIFNDTESVDAVINALQEVRKHIKSE